MTLTEPEGRLIVAALRLLAMWSGDQAEKAAKAGNVTKAAEHGDAVRGAAGLAKRIEDSLPKAGNIIHIRG